MALNPQSVYIQARCQAAPAQGNSHSLSALSSLPRLSLPGPNAQVLQSRATSVSEPLTLGFSVSPWERSRQGGEA